MTEFICRLVKNILGGTFVIIFKHGNLATPILILDDYAFEHMINDYNKQKKEFTK